ncbi:MAG: hypothetical protein DRI36_04035 [Caldiserica bacterium]|nr:MAG: hypothetical protein DRI36_04035 [Caldisericota bacterium]
MEKSGYLVIDDFDDGDLISKIGGTEGTWNCNPQDKSQFCKMYFSKDTPTGDGYSIRLRYDIDSPITYDSEYPNIAFNGFYIKLNGLDISGFDYLGVNLKGTTPQVKMEVKFEDGNFEKFIIRGIKRFWDKYYVYLKRKGRVKEIVFVFDKDTPIREGVLYIDNIVLRKREYRRIE